MKLQVIRNTDDGQETLGDMYVLDDNGANIFSCKTLERPYKDNQTGVSCIPANIYTVNKVGASHIPYPHFAIQDVPNRSGICIHSANFVSQLEGCIAVGDKQIDLNGDGEKDVADSMTTFNKLMSLLPDTFQIEIKGV